VWVASGDAGIHRIGVSPFSDVPQTAYFYPPVQELYCWGVLHGYADGTFRPYGEVTRGQLAKIVAAAAGIADPVPPTRQTYADVPPSQPFWLWVEQLAARQVVSGYACGGVGEPCDSVRRPYFRPGANATRGQITKIVASAAGFPEPIPTTRQTFADVPPSKAFWLFVERLAARQIISGYACGGPGEPCDPQNRPYFRWGNPTTRGQMAKIAANAFAAPTADGAWK
jgi:hypothetical protein